MRKGRRSAALRLTDEEARHFRVALGNIARAHGGYPVLAQIVGVPVASLYQAASERRHPSTVLALRVAQAAGMSVEAIIGPTLNEIGRCEACGSRVGDRRAS